MLLHVLSYEIIIMVFQNGYRTGKLRFLQGNHSNREIQYLLIPDKTKCKKCVGWCDWNSRLLETSIPFTEMILN